ncbi:LysR family transcriptional regulator [Photobacterium rosenbergii]|uniref:LysR family transcriptional regulator n=1 Tax=Photobacterium rosenbergii TaxID=294936 RepID=A0A2T3N2B1_9GAMM|nr:LysR family transcriptional regulator [Photobacterium rosenbergii]PSW06365.1 LysR family transcriptional regulator [Photobacterium rosenbergii]
MDIEGIRLFVLAADILNISAAGRQLGLAPAVASAKLAKLEHQIGADLLHRSTRKVALSAEGAKFLPFAREIIAQEDAARAILSNSTKEISGTLRFAATSTFSQLYIAPILPEFLARYPGINLELKMSDTKVNLIEGGFDLALRNYAIEDSNLKARKLADDRRILCASPEYLAQFGTPQTPDDLTKHQLLVFMRDSARELTATELSTTELEHSSCSFPPKQAKSRVICDDGSTMRVATMAGVGISMNAYWSVHNELKDGTLVHVLPNYEVTDQSAIWLVYPKSNVLPAKVRVFIDYILEKIGDPPIWER